MGLRLSDQGWVLIVEVATAADRENRDEGHTQG